jgi:cell wall-associated NlpC family hydrolase
VATAPRTTLLARNLRIRSRRGLSVLAAIAALGAVVVGPAGSSSAAPQATIAQVQARVHALNEEAERITEAYNAKRERLAELQQQQTIARRQLGREQRRLAAVQKSMTATAQAAFRNGGLTDVLPTITSDPQTFLDQSSILDALSQSQAEQFADIAAAGHAVQVARARYAAQEEAVRSSLAEIKADKARIESLINEAQRLLSTLRAEQRARLAAQQQRAAAAAVAQRESYTGPASGRAAAAVQFAYAQLGKPYVYGAAGPNAYDCSGLTMAAWAAAGVSLPHNAAMQQSMLPYVSRENLQPGDLVFFGNPAGHVGIYIGGGRFIHAPHTGDVVRIADLAYMPFSGGGRP